MRISELGVPGLHICCVKVRNLFYLDMRKAFDDLIFYVILGEIKEVERIGV